MPHYSRSRHRSRSRSRSREIYHERHLKKRERSHHHHHQSKHRRKSPEPDINKRHKSDTNNHKEHNSIKSKKTTSPKKQIEEKKVDASFFQKGVFGGVYIPPFKLARMMKACEDDKNSEQYQRLRWDALRKSLNGIVNKVNSTNIRHVLPELFSENLIRGRGLFCRAVMKSQMASPSFSPVYAALVAIVNTKFPEIGELLLKRVILQFKRSYKRNDKPICIATTKLISHLVNQGVAHELLALELLMVILEKPTNDSIEVAVDFTKEIGATLQELSPQGLHSVFECLRTILHEGTIEKRSQFIIEGLFAIRKAGFETAGFKSVTDELDLVEEEDQITHEIGLDEDLNPEMHLDVFKKEDDFEKNEQEYNKIKVDILGEESGESEGEGESDDDSDSESDEEGKDGNKLNIEDRTETDEVNLRRTIYLTIMSSLDFEEAGHKLLNIKVKPGQESEFVTMIIECCSQERTYIKYYGLLAQRFAFLSQTYQVLFEESFAFQYAHIHRLETNKLRNIAKLFAHLMATDAISWGVLQVIRLTEEDTTSSSRIFIKILFQELSEILGLTDLNKHLNDEENIEWYEGIFPKDTPRNMRFSINFFTSIGLGGITDVMRDLLKQLPKSQPKKELAKSSKLTSSSSGEEASDSDTDSDSDDSKEEASDNSSQPDASDHSNSS